MTGFLAKSDFLLTTGVLFETTGLIEFVETTEVLFEFLVFLLWEFPEFEEVFMRLKIRVN
jgi:hypothetical protein